MYKGLLITSLLTLSFNALSMAGDKGNGGFSIVCRDTNGVITSAELLDIYEGRMIHQRKYSMKLLPVDRLISVAQNRVQHDLAFSDKLRSELDKIKQKVAFIPAGNELEMTDDALPVIKKTDCKFEQVANYTNNGEVIIAQEIFDQFDNTSKAALFIHEAVYAIRRKSLGESTSEASRKLTAHLLADNNNHWLITRMLEESLPKVSSDLRPCGLTGSISERIEDCSFQKKPKFVTVLVTRTKENKEVYKDLASGLLWSDRLPYKMNLSMAKTSCRNARIPELGNLTGDWRLPTAAEYEYASPRLVSILPGMYGDSESYWFWTSSTSARIPLVFNADSGDIELEFMKSKNSGSVRCVLAE